MTKPVKVSQAYNLHFGAWDKRDQEFEASVGYIDTLRPI